MLTTNILDFSLIVIADSMPLCLVAPLVNYDTLSFIYLDDKSEKKV